VYCTYQCNECFVFSLLILKRKQSPAAFILSRITYSFMHTCHERTVLLLCKKAIKVNRYWFNKNNKKTWKQKETKKNKNKFTLGNHPVVSSSHVHQNGSRLVLNSRQASELKQFVPIHSGLLTMTNFCPITDYDWLFKLTHLVSAEQTQHRIRK
jgi:hypothetical protein